MQVLGLHEQIEGDIRTVCLHPFDAAVFGLKADILVGVRLIHHYHINPHLLEGGNIVALHVGQCLELRLQFVDSFLDVPHGMSGSVGHDRLFQRPFIVLHLPVDNLPLRLDRKRDLLK